MDNKKNNDVEAHGFDDAELADIMSEIEDLENDLSSSEDPSGAVEEEKIDSEPIVEAKNESKEVLLKLAEMPQEVAVKTTPPKVQESAKSCAESKMEFSVAGSMVVNLTFHVGGESINLSVDESKGLVIEMDGGAKFSLPLSSGAKGKKVA